MKERLPNIVLAALAATLIAAGCLLMLPPHSDGPPEAPGPGAFAPVRIRVAPATCFAGFVLMVPAIMYVPRRKNEDAHLPDKDAPSER